MPALSRHRLTDNPERCWSGNDIFGAYGIAIHLGTIKRWHVEIRNNILSEDPVQRLSELDLFDGKCFSFVDDDLNCFGDRNHILSALSAKNRKAGFGPASQG